MLGRLLFDERQTALAKWVVLVHDRNACNAGGGEVLQDGTQLSPVAGLQMKQQWAAGLSERF